MNSSSLLLSVLVLGAYLTFPLQATSDQPAEPSRSTDPRHIENGSVIPDEGYCDEPHVVITKDGNWLCTLTTGPGLEGQGGQHVVAAISTDKGKTWSDLIDIEPSSGPEASWVVPLITPSGRVYAFYNYNGDRIYTLGKRKKIRADTFGWYVYKYSDDNGRTWSDKQYRLPVRLTACDRNNDWKGKVQMFWGIDKPLVAGSSVYFAFTKLGRYMLDEGEGWVFRSDNILTEPDVEKIEWQMLPNRDAGLRAREFGSVQEEHNVIDLSNGSLYCIYRTTMGFICHTYSRDGGHTWTPIEPAVYSPAGRIIRNPRACPKLWKTSNGRFLLWYHNHGGTGFEGRNPAWLCAGVEKKGRIHWSQPEILLYADDPEMRMSYPDLIEQDGRYWVCETQKTIARVHEIDTTLLEGLWNQGETKEVVKEGLVLDLNSPAAIQTARTKGALMPTLPDLSQGGGFSIDFWVSLDDLSPVQVILDSRGKAGKGIRVQTTQAGTIEISLGDGKQQVEWDCDRGLLKPYQLHHIAIVVDGGPKIVTFIVDGVLCDGGAGRQYGWGRFPSDLGNVKGTKALRLMRGRFDGELKCLRVYDRYRRTSEVISNYLAGPE